MSDLSVIAPTTIPVSRAERSRRTNELMLDAHATDDPQLRAQLLDEVIVLNRCVAEAVANRYRGRGVPAEDLHQAAYEGLVKAVHHFDPAVRPDLLTYAVPTMRGQVQRWFRDQSWMIRPPRRVQELQWQVNRSIEKLTTAYGRPPTDDELCRDLDCTPAELSESVQAFGCFSPPSLDRPLGGDPGTTLGDLLVSETDEHSSADARVTLAKVLPALPERDRTILFMLYVEERTQKEVGAALGVTQMQVSRLLRRILWSLRTELAA